jgi:putative DNA primase/helicase
VDRLFKESGLYRGKWVDKWRRRGAAEVDNAIGHVRSQGGRGPKGGRKRRRLTDVGNAERLVDQHGENVRYCHPWKKWLVWDGTRWRDDDTGQVPRWAVETIRRIYAEAGEETDEDQRALVADHAHKSEHASRVAGMVKMAESRGGVPVTPNQLDQHHWLLNCPNGVLDLKAGVLRGHRREDLLTKLCPTAYDPQQRVSRLATG